MSNDRRVTVEGKQEHKTTGNHISLVEGKHSLEVKGDLAEKVSGALGIKVDGDIVLESSSRISLKVGGSFVVIHSGGVDIVGPKINLNGGGSPGTVVQTLLPDEVNINSYNNKDESGKYYIQFYFVDENERPYSNIEYISFLPDNIKTRGKTDQQGYTELFIRDDDRAIAVKLINPDFDTCWGVENE